MRLGTGLSNRPALSDGNHSPARCPDGLPASFASVSLAARRDVSESLWQTMGTELWSLCDRAAHLRRRYADHPW